MTKKKLPNRRDHITHKVKIGGVRTLYLSIDAEPPNELWLRVKQHGLDAEKVALYDTLAQMISMMLKHGIPLEEICKPLIGVRFEPCGVVTGDPFIKMCGSTLSFIGTFLIGRFCGRADLFQVKPEKDKAL